MVKDIVQFHVVKDILSKYIVEDMEVNIPV